PTVAYLQTDPSARRLRERAIAFRKSAASHRLLQALESESPHLKVIAEFKRGSPSAGIIRADLSPSEVARRYERGGACAISVLTDEEHFSGSIADLRAVRSSTNLPILSRFRFRWRQASASSPKLRATKSWLARVDCKVRNHWITFAPSGSAGFSSAKP